MDLFVSAPGLTEDVVLDWMRRHALVGHTQATRSLRAEGTVEPGCLARIHRVLGPDELRPAWQDLRGAAGLSCAHLVVHGTYRGCVTGYLDPPCGHR